MPSAPKRPCWHAGCRELQPCSVHAPHTKPGQSYADRKHEPGRALYDTQAWRKARKAFLRDHPLCVDCERIHVITLAAVVDHITPHRGDERLFWDRERNWQALCTRCHSKKTRNEMNIARLNV